MKLGGRRLWMVGSVVGIVAVSAVALVATPIVRSNAEVRSLRRLVEESIANHREAEASQLLDRWAALAPKDGEPDYYRARLEVRRDRPAEALDAIRKSLALGYPEPPLMVLRAVLLARAGRFEEAEPVLARAFLGGVEPRDDVAEGLSRIYLQTFRMLEATRVLESWMMFAPEDPRPYLRRNEIDERVDNDPALVIRNYREALRRDPNLLDARLGLAEKLRDNSQTAEAETEFAALLERDPKNVRGLVGAGRIAMLKGNLRAAINHYEAALALDPREKIALRELGLIDLNEGRMPSACDRLKRAVEVDPYDPEVRYSYARALKMAGNETRAAEEAAATERLKKEQKRMTELRQSLVDHPGDLDLRLEAARFLIEHGHEKEGLEWTALILRERPGHPATSRFLAEYHDRKGEFGLANFYRTTASPEPPKP